MAENRPNYCQLLGMNPLKESSYSLADINKLIQKMGEVWANESRNKQNDTEKRFKSERLVEAIPHIETVMADATLRHKEFTDGVTLLKGKSQKLVQDCVILTNGKKVLIPGVMDPFLKKLRWEGVKEDDILQLSGVSKDKPPTVVPQKVENAYKSLRTVDTFTTVELLNRLISHPNLEIGLTPVGYGTSLDELRSAFNDCERRVNSVRQDILPDQDSYINCLRNVKLIIQDDSLMNTLTAYGKCNKVLEPVISTIELESTGQQLQRRYIDDLLKTVPQQELDTDMALKILQQTCYKKKIPVNFSERESTMDRCPHCGHLVPVDSNSVYCVVCGKELKCVCPSCGTIQAPSNSVCMKCGFNFTEGLQKSKIHLMNINGALDKGMIVKAEKELQLLQKVYPMHPEIASIKTSIERSKADLEAMKKIFGEAYSKKKYHEAKGVCDSIVSKFPGALSEDLELNHKYTDAKAKTESADGYCRKADETDVVQQKLDYYVTAIRICPDHPVAKNKLMEYPPYGPADAECKFDNSKCIIEYVPPKESGDNEIIFCIYREKNNFPRVDEDTRPLAEVKGRSFEDTSIESGVPYYYSVYSKRWGILSREGCHIGPVVILAEVQDVKVENIEGGLRLSYKKPKGCTRVRVWRCENVKNNASYIELGVRSDTVYDDVGLKGGREYVYLFVAEYDIHGRTERSAGTYVSRVAIDTPTPIRNMKIKWNKSDGTFSVKWSSEHKVLLFSSAKKIKMPGTLVKMDDIRSWMKEIVPIEEYPDGMRFNVADGSVLYLYPIIPTGNMGVYGNEFMLANLKPFRDVEKVVSNRDCILTMTWPPGAAAAKLVISDEEV